MLHPSALAPAPPSGVAVAAGALLALQLCAAVGASTARHSLDHARTAPPLESRIVNGDDADIVDYPFQAAIERNNRHMCGGVIISKLWVLTAAHCFRPPPPEPPSDFRVRAGTTKRHFGGITRSVERILSHPSANGLDFDVSLLRLSMPLLFGQTVQQIALPEQSDAEVPARRKLVVSGFGATAENAKLAPRLLKADLSVWSQRECADFYRQHANVTVSMRMFCAASPTQDACQGDSGGPITEVAPDAVKLVGVVSFGMGCGHKGYPGVYANLAHKDLRSFIKSKTGL